MRCPECGAPGYSRKTKTPEWRCRSQNCGHEWDATTHSSKLSSTLPKKKPTAHSKGLSSDTAKASATTLLDSSTQEPTRSWPPTSILEAIPSGRRAPRRWVVQ